MFPGPTFQLFSHGDVPTATQLSNVDMEWLNFAWQMGIEESEYVQLMYHLQHGRNYEGFNILHLQGPDLNEELSEVDDDYYNVPEDFVDDDVNLVNDTADERESGDNGEGPSVRSVNFDEGESDEENWWREYSEDSDSALDSDSESEDVVDIDSDSESSLDEEVISNTESSSDTDMDSDSSTDDGSDSDSDFNSHSDTVIDRDKSLTDSDVTLAEEEPKPGPSWKMSREEKKKADKGHNQQLRRSESDTDSDSDVLEQSAKTRKDSDQNGTDAIPQQSSVHNLGSEVVLDSDDQLPASSRKRSKEDDHDCDENKSKRFRWWEEFNDTDSADEGNRAPSRESGLSDRGDSNSSVKKTLRSCVTKAHKSLDRQRCLSASSQRKSGEEDQQGSNKCTRKRRL